MEAVQAQLDGLAATYTRLLAQVDGLLEENSSLKRQLCGVGLLDAREDGHHAVDLPMPPTPKATGDEGGEAAMVQRSASGGTKGTLACGESSRASRFELCEAWADEEDEAMLESQGSRAMAARSSIVGSSTHGGYQGDMLTDNSCLQGFVMKPSDRRRMLWDLISVFVLAYDLIMLPLVVFGYPENMAFFVANAATACVWVADIVASFLSGYYSQGRLELRPRKIAVHYLKRWFFLDLSISTLDVVELVAWHDAIDVNGALRVGKISRFTRVLRLIRLLRLVRIVDLMSVRVRHDSARTVMHIMHLLVAIAFFNHFIACGWYGLGTWSELDPMTPTWVQQLISNDTSFADRNEFYFYSTALHWAFTQCTPASMEVVPRNSLERCYTIVVLVVGMGLFSSLISSITGTMTQFRQRRLERSKQRNILRQYLANHHVSLNVGNQVLAFLQYRGYAVTERLIDKDIPALRKLPERLQERLDREVYTPVLRAHPLFVWLDQCSEAGIQRICHMAMSQQIVLDGHSLFRFGEEAHKMYFVTDGTMEYFVGTSELSAAVALVRPPGHISEACLWVGWKHRGRLVAERDAEVVAMEARAFHWVVRNTEALNVCRRFARAFCSMLEDMIFESLTDMSVHDEQLREMTSAALDEARV